MTTGIKKGIRTPAKPAQSIDEALRELKMGNRKRGQEYRDQSLRIHGNICARCAKEFAPTEIHLLTVHHKDSNSTNNPADGSNWENLCVYCHEAEHSRELLGDYVDGGEAGKAAGTSKPSGGLGTFADLLKRGSKK